MPISAYLNKWDQIPVAVKKFFIKGLLMLVAWKVIYLGFLAPGRILDAPLTTIVGKATCWGANLVTGSHDYTSKNEIGRALDIGNTNGEMQQSVYFHNLKVAGVYDSCNALELMVLYVGFIICIPAPARRKWVYALGGLIAIFVINVVRCVGVVYVMRYFRPYTDFFHHYVFEFMVYGSIIGLWLLFTHNIKLKANAAQ